jgi:hypothetical protein
MKPTLTLTALFFAFVLPRVSGFAQEHVDVPLPPYDPPPPASHHREVQSAEPPRVSQKSHSPAKVSSRRPSLSQGRAVKNSKRSHSHHRPRHRRQARHRRHSFFHWPWQHRKRLR